MSEPEGIGYVHGWRGRMYEIIFEADTPAGKGFDVVLLAAIALSVMAVVLESVETIARRHGTALRVAEWAFTLLFTAEYLLRLAAVKRPLRYARSFFGVVDLLAVIPTYLSLGIAGSQSLIVIRSLRLLRVFRVFKVARFVGEMQSLVRALRATSAKITVFLFTVLTLVLIMGSAMYVIEGRESGFTSIPRSVYWAIVTVTTVGYGDITPRTVLGQGMAAAAMIIGYSLIIIPTGIFSMELIEATRGLEAARTCSSCSRSGHDMDAHHCKHCGERM